MRPPPPMVANKLAPINGSAAISNPTRNVFDDLNINNTIRSAFDSSNKNQNTPMASMQQQLNGAQNAPNLSMSGISCSIGSTYHEQQTMHPLNIGGPNFGTEQQHYSSPSKMTQGVLSIVFVNVFHNLFRSLYDIISIVFMSFLWERYLNLFGCSRLCAPFDQSWMRRKETLKGRPEQKSNFVVFFLCLCAYFMFSNCFSFGNCHII